MATPDDIQKQLASRQPKVTPVGDVPAATARANAPSAMDVPSATPTAQATAAPAQARLTSPPDFIGDAAGGVQRNTPSANWSTTPGASSGNPSTWSTEPGASTAPISRSAAQITEAPAWQTSPGAGAPAGTIDAPAAPTRAVQYTPKPATAAPGAAPVTDPNDITAEFQKRMRYEAERRANLAAETAAAPTPAPGAATGPTPAAPAASMSERAGAAAGRAVRASGDVAGRAIRLGAAPVETAPRRGFIGRAADKVGLPGRAAPGQRAGTAGALATVGALSALQSLNTDTDEYRKRLGMSTNDESTIGDIAARTAGTLEDFGSSILNTPVHLLNGMGMSIRPFGEAMGEGRTNGEFQPHYATDPGHGFWGGFASQLTPQEQKENAEWRANMLQEQADAAREAAGGKPSSAAAMTTAPTSANAAAPATGNAAAPATAQPANAQPKVNFITPDNPAGIHPPSPADQTPEQAMNSTAPGTAVINGRVLSAKEIADAGKRLNIVPSSAFTNPDVGDLYSQTHGGATPTSDQAIALRNSLNGSASAQRMFGTDASGNPVGVSGGIGAPQDPRQSTIQGLMGQISDALRSGRRRTAKILVDQLSAFDRASQGDMDNSLRRDALNKPQQPAPQTAAQQALDAARAGAAQTQEQVEQMSLAQAKQAQQIQAALQIETDPGKRKVLQQNLAAITGKGGSSANQLKMANFTVGSGLDTRTIPVPIDLTTGKPVISPEYIQLIQSLQGGQPQAPQKG